MTDAEGGIDGDAKAVRDPDAGVCALMQGKCGGASWGWTCCGLRGVPYDVDAGCLRAPLQALFCIPEPSDSPCTSTDEDGCLTREGEAGVDVFWTGEYGRFPGPEAGLQSCAGPLEAEVLNAHQRGIYCKP